MIVQRACVGTDFFSYLNAVAEEEALVAAAIANNFDIGIQLSVAFDQSTNCGGQARCETARGEEGDFFYGFCFSHHIFGRVEMEK